MTEQRLATLRPFELDDIETYRKGINDPAIGKMLDSVMPITRTEHEDWYKRLLDNERAVVFAINAPAVGAKITTTQYIGNVWLWDIDCRHRKAEVRIVIVEQKYQDHGYGTDALEQIVDFAFNKLNLHRVYAYILNNNKVSIKAFANAGFREEGELKDDRFADGEYVDTVVVARVNGD